eukprot:TRINITY_DN958_c1_g1_i1.p1 TRINITY_DN958_c1_g1~~TRINITY_DN958_c1_g1_i1.p1  ORF type:complete len:2067 (+),score=674.73 TRINITY_DN958_c1_g1_i1:129-6329(+)
MDGDALIVPALVIPQNVGDGGARPQRSPSMRGGAVSPSFLGSALGSARSRSERRRSRSHSKIANTAKWMTETHAAPPEYNAKDGAGPETPGGWIQRNAVSMQRGMDSVKLKDREAQTLSGCRAAVLQVMNKVLDRIRGLCLETTVIGQAICDVGDVFDRYEIQLDDEPPWLTEEVAILECMRTDAGPLASDHREDMIQHLRSIVRGLFKDKQEHDAKLIRAEQDVARKDAAFKYIKGTLWKEVVLLREQLYQRDTSGHFDRNVFSIFDVMELVEKLQGDRGGAAGALVEKEVLGNDEARRQLDEHIEKNRITWETRLREMSAAYDLEIRELKEKIETLGAMAEEEAVEAEEEEMEMEMSIRATHEEANGLRARIQELDAEVYSLNAKNSALEGVIQRHDDAFDAHVAEAAQQLSDAKLEVRKSEVAAAEAENAAVLAQKQLAAAEASERAMKAEMELLHQRLKELEDANALLTTKVKSLEQAYGEARDRAVAAERAAEVYQKDAAEMERVAHEAQAKLKDLVPALAAAKQRVQDLECDVDMHKVMKERAEKAAAAAEETLKAKEQSVKDLTARLEKAEEEQAEKAAALQGRLDAALKDAREQAVQVASLKKEVISSAQDIAALRKEKVTGVLLQEKTAGELRTAREEVVRLTDDVAKLRQAEEDLEGYLQTEQTSKQTLTDGLGVALQGFRKVLLMVQGVRACKAAVGEYRLHLSTMEELLGAAEEEREDVTLEIPDDDGPAFEPRGGDNMLGGGRRASRAFSMASSAAGGLRGRANEQKARKRAVDTIFSLLEHHSGQYDTNFLTRRRHRKDAHEALLVAQWAPGAVPDAQVNKCLLRVATAGGLVVMQKETSFVAVFNAPLFAIQCAAGVVCVNMYQMKFAVAVGEIDDRGHGTAEAAALKLVDPAPVGTVVLPVALAAQMREREVGGLSGMRVTAGDEFDLVVLWARPGEDDGGQTSAHNRRYAKRLEAAYTTHDAGRPVVATAKAFDAFLSDRSAMLSGAGDSARAGGRSTLEGHSGTQATMRAAAQRAAQEREQVAARAAEMLKNFTFATPTKSGSDGDAGTRSASGSQSGGEEDVEAPQLPQREQMLFDTLHEAVETCLWGADQLRADYNAAAMECARAQHDAAQLRAALSQNVDDARHDLTARLDNARAELAGHAAEIARLRAELRARPVDAGSGNSNLLTVGQLLLTAGYADGLSALCASVTPARAVAVVGPMTVHCATQTTEEWIGTTPGTTLADASPLDAALLSPTAAGSLQCGTASVIFAPGARVGRGGVIMQGPQGTSERGSPKLAPLLKSAHAARLWKSAVQRSKDKAEERPQDSATGSDLSALGVSPPRTDGGGEERETKGGLWQRLKTGMLPTKLPAAGKRLQAVMQLATQNVVLVKQAELHEPPGSPQRTPRVSGSPRRSQLSGAGSPRATPRATPRARGTPRNGAFMGSPAASPRGGAGMSPRHLGLSERLPRAERMLLDGDGDANEVSLNLPAPEARRGPRRSLTTAPDPPSRQRSPSIVSIADDEPLSRPGSAAQQPRRGSALKRLGSAGSASSRVSQPRRPGSASSGLVPLPDAHAAATPARPLSRVGSAASTRPGSGSASRGGIPRVPERQDHPLPPPADHTPLTAMLASLSQRAAIEDVPAAVCDDPPGVDVDDADYANQDPLALTLQSQLHKERLAALSTPLHVALRREEWAADDGSVQEAIGTHLNNPFEMSHSRDAKRAPGNRVRRAGSRFSPARERAGREAPSIPSRQTLADGAVSGQGVNLSLSPRKQVAMAAAHEEVPDAPGALALAVQPTSASPSASIPTYSEPLVAVRQRVVPPHGRPTVTAKYVPTNLAVSGAAVGGANPTQAALDVTRAVREVQHAMGVEDLMREARAASPPMTPERKPQHPLMRATGPPGLGLLAAPDAMQVVQLSPRRGAAAVEEPCREIVPYTGPAAGPAPGAAGSPRQAVCDPFMDYIRFVPEDPVNVLQVATRPGPLGRRAGSAKGGRTRPQIKDLHPTIASIMGYPKKEAAAEALSRPASGSAARLGSRRGTSDPPLSRPGTGNAAGRKPPGRSRPRT